MKYICKEEFFNVVDELTFEKGKTYDVIYLGKGRYRVIPTLVKGYYTFGILCFFDYFSLSFKFGR